MLKILVDYSKRPDFDQILLKSTLSFVSLNSTNVSLGDIFKESFERVLMKLPNLKYVDFSNNQRLFGTFGKSDNEEADANEVASVNYFISKLPLSLNWFDFIWKMRILVNRQFTNCGNTTILQKLGILFYFGFQT